MRKVIYGINMTADGCCDHTKGVGGADIHAYFTDLLRDADLLVYGRKTYELMVPYWPDVAKSESGTAYELEFARIFTGIEKVVFSRTLTNAEGNTRIVRDGLMEEVMRLKQLPGGNISVGGIDLPGQLIAMGLVDEFHIVVHPVIAGEGRRLMEGSSLQDMAYLQLVATRALESGCVAMHYARG